MAFRASSIDATHPPHRIEGAESAITCPTEGVAFDMVWRYPAGGKRPLGRSAVTLRMIGSDGGTWVSGHCNARPRGQIAVDAIPNLTCERRSSHHDDPSFSRCER